MKTIGQKFFAAIVVLGLLMGGCKKEPTPLDQSAASAQLKHFIAEKHAQATAAAAAEKREMLPEFKTIFAAADKGDWQTISNTFNDLRQLPLRYPERNAITAPDRGWFHNLIGHLRYQMEERRGDLAKVERLQGTQWEDVREIWGAFDCLASDVALDKYFVTLGREIIGSIPAGSIYFGGSDPGRWTVTALQTSHVNGDPFFTLTQNAMADPLYLQCIRDMYGKKIYIPTADDSRQCFRHYMEDAQRRIVHDQASLGEPKLVKPGEDVRLDAAGHVQVSGQIAVMAINAELVKVVFDHETNREFYVEESSPLEWMYPHLEPHGLIMKINREPLAELPDEVIRNDHEFWKSRITPVIGDWLKEDTSVPEICTFAEKIYLRHDFNGFKGDTQIVNVLDDWTGWMSKLRRSIAEIYAWRAGISLSGATVPSRFIATGEARNRMIREADFGCRQAFALCPRSTETVWLYANFLVNQRRFADALSVAETGLVLHKGKPDADSFQTLVTTIKACNGQQGSIFIMPPQPIEK